MQLKSIECIALEKRNKKQVYILNVITSNNEYEISRTYTTFFDFRNKLVENAKQLSGVIIPELLDLKWFEKALGKASEKRKRQINEFCKEVLELPTELSECEHVHEFFQKWPSDESDAQAEQSTRNKKKRKSVEKTLSAEKQVSKGLVKEIQDVQKTRKISGAIEPANGLRKEPGHRHSVDNVVDSRPLLKKEMSRSDSVESLDQYVAIQDVTKVQESDLNLADGDIVHVLEKNLSGWWFVMKENGDQGWAPGGVLQPLDPDKREDESDTEQVQEDQCPIYEAISDYTAKDNDEVTYRKSEKVHVLQMRTDGWWKVRRSNGSIGITPAVNLARISDGSGPTDPLYSDITMYSQQSVYKKKTPPKRNTSRLSLSELYAKVERKPMKPQKPKPVRISEHVSSSPPYLASTLTADRNRPQVPPKKPGLLKQDNYVEIEFNEDENDKRKSKDKKFSIVSDGVEYSEINPGSLPQKLPKPSDDLESHMYKNITRQSQPSYENVDEVKPKSMVNQFFEVTQDYNPFLKHSEGLPAVKGDIIKVTKDERQHVFCVMCLKERIDTKPCEGAIPKKLLRHVNVEVIDRDAHDIPVVQVLDTAPIEASQDLYMDALKSPSRPDKSRAFWGKNRVKKGEWFAGQMSREECEELLKDAKDLEFVIRESQRGNEEFSISVRYHDIVKHFKVEKVAEGKFQIGGYIFKNLSAIVKHYTKHALFNVENGKSTSLGKPYKKKEKGSNSL